MLACTPALLDADCKTIEQMRLVSAVCWFVELAGSGRRCVSFAPLGTASRVAYLLGRLASSRSTSCTALHPAEVVGARVERALAGEPIVALLAVVGDRAGAGEGRQRGRLQLRDRRRQRSALGDGEAARAAVVGADRRRRDARTPVADARLAHSAGGADAHEDLRLRRGGGGSDAAGCQDGEGEEKKLGTASHLPYIRRPSRSRHAILIPVSSLVASRRTTSTGVARSAAADERHLRRHHRHELDVRVERQRRHVDDGSRHVGDVDRRLGHDVCRPACRTPARHLPGHLGGRVADVDLPAGDVVVPAVERRRLREPGDRVLRRRVRRRVRARNRARRSSRC